jgi:hypothetical protein
MVLPRLLLALLALSGERCLVGGGIEFIWQDEADRGVLCLIRGYCI